MKPILINLDLKTNSYEDIELKQGCQDTLIANITDLGDVVDLTGQVIAVEMLKGDNTFIIQTNDITVSTNKVTIKLNKDFTRVKGKTKLQIKMAKSGVVSGSWVVVAWVREGAIDKAIGESGNIVTIKEELDNSIVKATEENKKTQDLIATGGAATKGEVKVISEQLAEMEQLKADKTVVVKKGYGTLNDFDEETRKAILENNNIDINYVLGEENVIIENLNPNIFVEDDITIYDVTTNNEYERQAYLGFLFDTDGINVLNDSDITFIFKVNSDDLNITSIYAKCFCNNDPFTTELLGGTLDTFENGKDTNINKKYQIKMSIKYDNRYRYVKPYIVAVPNSDGLLVNFKVKDVRCFIGENEIKLLNYSLYQTNGGYVNLIKSKSKALVTIDMLKEYNKGKWTGKKANFLGDSITQGLYYDSNTNSYVTATKPYHQHLKELLGLSVVNNYGVSGTHISGAYQSNNNGESSQSDNFISRFSIMEDDVDLVVVFGGTNDYGHNYTAPFGTISDRGDVSFYGGLHTLMHGLINKYLGKTIVFMTPIHREGDYNLNPITNKTLKDYINAIKEVAEFYGIYVIDTFSISQLSCNVPIIKTTYMNDGLHPNELGHEYLGKKIYGIFNVI